MTIWRDYRDVSRQLTFSSESLIWHPMKMVAHYLNKSPVSLYYGIIMGQKLKDTFTFSIPSSFIKQWKYALVSSMSRTLCKLTEVYSFNTVQRNAQPITSLPLLESVVCRFAGYLPFRQVTRRTKIGYSDSNFDKFAINTPLVPNIGWGKVFNDKVMLSGGMDAIIPNLRTMATEPVSKFSYEDMIRAVSKRFSCIDLPTIIEPQVHWLDSIKVNASAYPGFFSSLFYGNTKADVAEVTTIVAKAMFKRVTEGRTHALEVWKFGSRPKLVNLEDDGKVLRTRPIAMCDDVLNKVCSVFSQPLTEALVRSPMSEIFTGRSLGYDEVNWITDYIAAPDCLCASPDWSQFDNHVYEELLVVAFAILRQSLPRGWRMDNLAYYILSSLVDKFVVIDPGLLFKIMKGIPSGHPFTSLIGTICNWVLWSTIFMKYCEIKGIELNSKFRVVCSGDDTLVRIPFDTDLQTLQKVIDSSGMKADPFSDTVGLFHTTDGTDGACFLRRRFLLDGMVTWDRDYLVEKLRFPESVKTESTFETVVRVLDYQRMGPGFSQSLFLLQDYAMHLAALLQDDTSGFSLDYFREDVERQHSLATFDYLFDTGLGEVRKEGWELKRQSKMKIIVSTLIKGKEYFVKGASSFIKLIWDSKTREDLNKQKFRVNLNFKSRFSILHVTNE